MNTLQLECFVAVAEKLNYAKAAEEVHMSQPAVSKKIQSLEEELEIRLFERDTRHVALTYAGKQFYSNAKSILLQQQNAMASIAQLKAQAKKSLVIGCHNAEIYGYIGKVLSSVLRKTPIISPDIMDAPFQTLNMGLTEQSIDIVIGTYEMMTVAGMRDNAFKALAPSPVYCIIAADKAGNFPETLRLEELTVDNLKKRLGIEIRITTNDLEHYLAQSDEWLPVVSRFGRNTLACDNVEGALCMVEAGVGLMFMPTPDLLCSDRFRYIPVVDAHMFNYGYFYNKENNNPVLDIFRQELETAFR